MNNLTKCILTLSVIAIICTSLLSLANYFWKVEPIDKSQELLNSVYGDSATVELNSEDTVEFTNGITRAFGITDNGQKCIAVYVTGSHQYGSLNLFVAFDSEDNIKKISLISTEGAQFWDYPLVPSVFDFFISKDPHTITRSDLLGASTIDPDGLDGISQATNSTNLMISSIQNAYDFVRTNSSALKGGIR